jgi:glycosyltransferase
LKISVITAVYNNRNTISDAIESILAQSHPAVELVVVDGGSTDGTLELLARFGDRITVMVSEPDDGIYHALNKGIGIASGDVVGFLHSDDVFPDVDALKRVAAVFATSGAEAVYGDLEYVQRNDVTKVVRYWHAGVYSSRKLRGGWMPPHPTFYARRQLYQRLGGFDVSMRIAADYDCMLRVFQAGVAVGYIPQVQVRMRTGGTSNRSLGNIIRKSSEDYRALRGNKVGGAWALLCKNVRKLPQFFVRRSPAIKRT